MIESMHAIDRLRKWTLGNCYNFATKKRRKETRRNADDVKCLVCGRSVYSAHTSYVVDVVVAKYTNTHNHMHDMISFPKCMFMAKTYTYT